MTPDEVDALKPRLSPKAFEVARRVVRGWQAHSLRKNLSLTVGQLAVLRDEIRAVAEVPGLERIPSPVTKQEHSARIKAATEKVRTMPRAKSCDRCGLRGKHECMPDVTAYARRDGYMAEVSLGDGRK